MRWIRACTASRSSAGCVLVRAGVRAFAPCRRTPSSLARLCHRSSAPLFCCPCASFLCLIFCGTIYPAAPRCSLPARLSACLPAVPPRRHPCPLFVFVTTSVFLPCISSVSHDRPSLAVSLFHCFYLLLYSTLSTLYHPPRSVHNSQTDLDPDPNHDSDPGLDSDPNPHAFFCSTIPSSTPPRPLAPFSSLHFPRSIFLTRSAQIVPRGAVYGFFHGALSTSTASPLNMVPTG